MSRLLRHDVDLIDLRPQRDGSHADHHVHNSGSLASKPIPDVTHTLLSDSDSANSSSARQPHAHNQLARQLWQPFWHRRTVLATFLCMYAAFIVATLIVYYISRKNDGLPVSQSASHYAWTYGPTTVLVLAVSLWRQIDHHCKQLAPWSQMFNRPTRARLSLLMDYLSPLQIVSFVQAFRDRQYSVVATITGFVLLKLITVASTGFLVLGTFFVSELGQPLIVTTRFDDSNFSISGLYSNPSANALYAYYANTLQGLPFAVGVTGQYAYPTFEPVKTDMANATITAEVDVFRPGYNCTIVDSKISEVDLSGSGMLPITLADGQVCQQWNTFGIVRPDIKNDSVPQRSVTGSWQYAQCNESDPYDLDTNALITIFTILDAFYEPGPFFNESDGLTPYPNSTWDVTQLTTVACTPSPQILKAKISNDTTVPQNVELSFLDSEDVSLPSTFNRSQMNTFMITLLGSFSRFLNSSDIAYDQSLLRLMALTQDSTSTDFIPLLDGQALRNSAESVFNGVISQWVHLNLMRPVRDNITGDVRHMVTRLYVAQVSLWIMVTGFASLILVTIVVWFTTTKKVVTRDPGNIGAAASILSRSRGLNDLLFSIRADSEASLKSGLNSQDFSTSATEKDGVAVFCIDTSSTGSDSTDQKSNDEPPSHNQTWRPLSLSLPVIITTFILPLIVIVILEILQRLSDKHEGILTIAEGSEKYGFYIPVLVMLSVATLFNSLDFNVATLSVYSSLYHGQRLGDTSVCTNLLGNYTPHALFNAIRGGYFGAVMSTIASLTGSVLTIVVSGLYIIQEIQAPAASRHLERLGTFDLTWNDSISNDNHAALFLNLIDNVNMSYPNFTHSEIALPEFALGQFIEPLKSGSRLSGSSFVTLPALRGNLNCTVMPSSRLNVWTDQSGYFGGDNPDRAAYVNATIDLPQDCQQRIIDYQPSWSTFNNSFRFSAADLMYAGTLINLDYGPGFANVTWPYNFYAHPDVDSIGDNPPSCPSLAFTFGRFEWNSTDTSNITVMYCFQEVQKVQAVVALFPGSTQVDTSQPALVDESSVKNLLNGNSGGTAFQYRVQKNLASVLVTPDQYQFDGFFNALVNGSNTPAPEDLLGPENEQKLFDRINHFYRRYMAQAISANMRVACTEVTGSCDSVTGSSGTFAKRQSSANDELGVLTVYTTAHRIRQDKTSKLILQVMLAAMTICGMSAFWLTRMRKLLPYNPCSIAGTMGLLAGSQLCGGPPQVQEKHVSSTDSSDPLIPAGAEWMNDRDLKAVFARHTLRLGWWRTHDTPRSDNDTDRYERYGIDVGSRPTGRNDRSREHKPRRGDNDSRWRTLLRWRKGYQRPPT